MISASHNGYSNFIKTITHNRTWKLKDDYLLINDEISGKFHIKTGSLDHVSSLAGYMNYEGKRYAFAIIQNAEDVHKGFGEEVQEALMRWLYSYGNKTILEN